MRSLSLIVTCVFALAFLCDPQAGLAAAPPPFTHDPSTIAKCNNEYWVFSTGQGILTRHSKDIITWEAGPSVFKTAPAWTTNMVPRNRGYFWAPDIIEINHKYLLYYSVSSWGVNTSAIGLATNPTLDPADPRYHWTDAGLVVQSFKTNDFNTIDPSVALDADGKLWLAFGSFWSGIKVIQLDPSTGMRGSPDSPIYSVASHSQIEAACLVRHAPYYYLFVNWGQCCRGTNSTYNIRFGRGDRATGPFLDKDGVDLAQGGGSLFLGSDGPFIGPGHAGVFSEEGTNWLSFHYYDGRRRGRASLAVRRLAWDSTGWPVLASPVD